MGKIFRTPSDDAVEDTLKSIHLANKVDMAYERGMGWFKVLLFGTMAMFVVSAFEYYTEWNLWEYTGDAISGWSIRQLGKLV
tara:strand:+ start:292 stop:537 length:246 start_codon:yes stop_codon:yes gene_type:complete